MVLIESICVGAVAHGRYSIYWVQVVFMKCSPNADQIIYGCSVIVGTCVILYADHPSVPLDFEVDDLVLWVVSSLAGIGMSSVAVIRHSIGLISDEHLEVDLSACHAYFTVHRRLN